MELKKKLQQDVATAMREGASEKRDTLRMLLAAVKQSEIDNKIVLDDAGVLDVLQKQAKQRRESIHDYQQAGRAEMAATEESELVIIEAYLPQMMSREQVKAVAEQLVAELGVTDSKGMGQVMGRLMGQLKGRADGRLVNEVVRELLT